VEGEGLMQVDLSTWMAVGGALALLISLGTSIWTIFSGPAKAQAKRHDEAVKATDDRFAEGRARMDRHDQRISRLEQSHEAMPTKDDMHKVLLAVQDMKGRLDVMGAQMGGQKDIMERLETIVSRHEEHLLGGKR
jgi:small-conductance mechanosensitive channel